MLLPAGAQRIEIADLDELPWPEYNEGATAAWDTVMVEAQWAGSE